MDDTQLMELLEKAGEWMHLRGCQMIDSVDFLLERGQFSFEVLMAALKSLNRSQVPAQLLRVQFGDLLLHPVLGLVACPMEQFHTVNDIIVNSFHFLFNFIDYKIR